MLHSLQCAIKIERIYIYLLFFPKDIALPITKKGDYPSLLGIVRLAFSTSVLSIN